MSFQAKSWAANAWTKAQFNNADSNDQNAFNGSNTNFGFSLELACGSTTERPEMFDSSSDLIRGCWRLIYIKMSFARDYKKFKRYFIWRTQ